MRLIAAAAALLLAGVLLSVGSVYAPAAGVGWAGMLLLVLGVLVIVLHVALGDRHARPRLRGGAH